MKRVLRLGAPTVGTILLRVAQLAVLLAIARLAHGEVQSFLITGFGILAAFTIISDAGGTSFLLSVPADRLNRGVYRRALGLQASIAIIGPILLFAAAAGIAPNGVSTPFFWVLIALGVSQALDSVARAAKAPWLVQRRDHLFAFPDIATGVAKLLVVGIAILVQDLTVVAFMVVVSAVALVVTISLVRRTLQEDDGRYERQAWRMLEIGLTGALSSAYSQSPMLFAAWLLPLDTAAIFAVIYRVVQALELVPATAATQLVPRIGQQGRLLRLWLLFVTGGVAIVVVLLFAWPLVSAVFAIELPFEYTTPISMAFALKCGNYALVAHLLGSGLIRQRLAITITTGVSAVVIVPLLILAGQGFGLAIGALLIELVFLMMTLVILRAFRSSRKETL